MTMRRMLVYILVASPLVICALDAPILQPREAEAALATVTTCDGGTITLSADEKRTLELHNRARKERRLKPLCVHPVLTRAARAHSQEMLDRDYTSHNSYNGETVRQRLERYGYSFSGYSYYAYGENIGWGCGSAGAPDRRFKWWMNSSGHRSNILKNEFREVGIGVRAGTYESCDHTRMYTVDFGTRQS